MARGPKAGFYYAISALPILGAGVVGPDVFHTSEQVKAFIFFGCLGAAALLWIVGAVKELQEERQEIAPGRRRRMITTWGMIICGFGFLGFAAIHFGPIKTEALPTKAAVDERVPLGSLRFVMPTLDLEIKPDLSQISGRVIIEVHNDSDQLIYFDGTTAGNINGTAFDENRVQIHGYVYPKQSTNIISNRLTNIPVLRPKSSEDPSVYAVFEYDLRYGPADTKNLYRRTAKGVRIAQWIPLQRKPPGTIDTIPIRVVFYLEIEE